MLSVNRAQRMAGSRTNALVAIGAAMFVMLAMPTWPDETMRGPPRWFQGSASSAPASFCAKDRPRPPLARLIDRQPTEAGTATEALYLLRVVCRSEGENHARALLLQMTQTLPITMQSLHSEDLDATGKVEVRANFHSYGPQDAMLENVVGRMSLEPVIFAASWQVVTNQEQ